jgi:hypothetical protein
MAWGKLVVSEKSDRMSVKTVIVNQEERYSGNPKNEQ